MRARATEIEALDRPAVVRVAEQRARRPELVERKGAVEDVAADQAELALEVGRRKRGVADHALVEAGGMGFDDVEDALHGFALSSAPVHGRIEVLAKKAGDVCSL